MAAACSSDGAVSGDAPAADEGDATPARVDAERSEAPSITGRAPPASGGLPAVVVLRPAGEGTSPEATSTAPGTDGSGAFPEPVIDQFGLAFVPRTLLVPVGTPVTFTNSEGSLVHNVHVRSLAGDSTIFNDDAAPGDEVVVTLPEAGGYDVLCDMHPGMTAFVYATEAPWATVAGPDGRFRLTGLPPGRYSLRVWTPDGGLGGERVISVEQGATTDVDLTPSS